MQNRMLTAGPLHNRDGTLTETGYALTPIKHYERGKLSKPSFSVKECDSYLILGERCALTLTVSDLGLIGLDTISLWDFDTKEQFTASRRTLFPMGKRNLPAEPEEGVVRAIGKEHEITFRAENTHRQLYGHMYDFSGENGPLLFDLELKDPGLDRMVIVTPFKGKPGCFYFGQKITCLPVDGRVIFNKKEYLFSPASASAVLNWSRCVLPHKNTWFWGAASGYAAGKTFGMNLARGLGNSERATENALFFEGKAHKLGKVRFEAEEKNRREDAMAPWRIKDDAGRLDMRFEPILYQNVKTGNCLWGLREFQVLGRFSGFAELDSGTRLQITDLTGSIQKISGKG